MGIKNLQERALEEFVAVASLMLARRGDSGERHAQKDVVDHPATSGREEAMPVVTGEQAEALHVVAGDRLAVLALRSSNDLVGSLDVPDSIVEQPDMQQGGDAKRDAVSPLSQRNGVGRSL